ncbi:hypothetical protein JAAARDRAFT_199494 [Jaapia argillacea MUCL 33604]|uniref:Uncharacterized protein n=1 Tax=Jaapia argillacea MUCL 33604 TaxID=933084 RepID=A0A067PKJ5_9AGAM|nr:hypothetical protein JAAARDRAFT_199494 [Jaapia argillacea MUCL 33604]
MANSKSKMTGKGKHKRPIPSHEPDGTSSNESDEDSRPPVKKTRTSIKGGVSTPNSPRKDGSSSGKVPVTKSSGGGAKRAAKVDVETAPSSEPSPKASDKSKRVTSSTQKAGVAEGNSQRKKKPAPARSPTPSEAEEIAGNFDLYRMNLSSLHSVFLAKESKPGDTTRNRDYEGLYMKIMELQVKNTHTAQIYLPPFSESKFSDDESEPSRPGPKAQRFDPEVLGRLSSTSFQDPMAEEPYDISITALKSQPDLKFNLSERCYFGSKMFKSSSISHTIPGILGATRLAASHCGVDHASGDFKIRGPA